MGPSTTTATPRTPRRLTATALESLRPGPTRYEVTDPGCAGLQLRIQPSGAKSWTYRYYWHRKRVVLVLGPYPRVSLARARELAAECRRALDRQIDPRRAGIVGRATKVTTLATPTAPDAAEPVDPYSVAHLASEYLERHVKRQRKRPEYVERFLAAEVLPKWAGRDARTITPRAVVELLDGIVERGSPTMANRGAGILSQMFRYGVHRAIVDASPVQLLYRPGGKEKPRERALSDDETAAVLANLESVLRYQTGEGRRSPRLAHMLRLLLLTGQRRGELALARWHDVRLDDPSPVWRIPAEHSKTGSAHVVPLSPAAVREYRALKKYAGASDYVFPTDDGKAAGDARLITRGLARVMARLTAAAANSKPPVKLAPFTVHDLRRTCRTGLARLKVPHDVAERVLNHKLPAMREVYDQHEPLEEMRAALEQWAAHVQKLADAAGEHGEA